MAIDFDTAFKMLTGNPPLSWQSRMYRDYFALGKLPTVCDLPTGLGKTMVMAIWLIARSNGCHVPTRLIYVVDRRTVVDQATDVAAEFAYLLAPHNSEDDDRIARQNQKLVERKQQNSQQLTELCQDLGLRDGELFISTLRGQLADNRKWSTDPSRPAIIIGTVDLIGSGLLFSGYRSGFKRRPLEAGLLGQDSLLLLDEAHLSRPFQKLVGSITDFQSSHGKPMHVISMSATSGEPVDSTPFTLEFDADGKLSGADAKDEVIAERFYAKKRLTINAGVDPKKLIQALADSAIELARNDELKGKRIVVFTRRPDDAQKIAQEIRDRDKPGKSKANPEPQGPYADSVAVLTGTMRGLERDRLVQTSILKRFLDGSENPDLDENKRPVFLVSTSAGEVGFDLNADHLVGDEAPLDSWIQRLGRVNRRGKGEATIILAKVNNPSDKSEFDKACLATTNLLADITDVSPQALRALTKSLASEQAEQASSPKPTTVELTDILLDAWSMTSIRQSMPGRPAVGPWLRGIDDEQAQTTIAWRAELDLAGFAKLDPDDIEEWFETHRILTHETLGVKTSTAAKWFTDRWTALPEAMQQQVAKRPVIIDRAGMDVVPLGEVISRLSRKASDADAFLLGAEVIVPASFGGLRRGVGLLDSSEPKVDENDAEKAPEDQANSIDVADVGERESYRESTVKPEGEDSVSTPLIPGTVKPKEYARFSLELESDDEEVEKTVRLVSYVPRRERLEIGQEPQKLKSHVSMVRKAVDQIVSRLELPGEVAQAAQVAADWHDHGKNRERWQRLLVFRRNFVRPDEPMGKSDGEMKRDPRGYRHEFGSLREFTDAFNSGNLSSESGDPISQEVFDLAAHLIATHHGRGRPHFPKGGFDPDCESRSDEIHTVAIRRFAQLQRKYGWWHLAWLENLLRCADAMASADKNAKDDSKDAGGDEP